MQLIASRTYSFIDTDSLAEHQAFDDLYRGEDGSFILRMSSDKPVNDDRLVWLDARTAVAWAGESADDYGACWE